MRPDLSNIKGKVAMVTGARRGLGLAMARGLVGAGAKLVAVASSPDCCALRQAVRKPGGEIINIASLASFQGGWAWTLPEAVCGCVSEGR